MSHNRYYSHPKRMFPETAGIPEFHLPPANNAGPDFDPVLHANGAKASGRIGNVAWALFERGDGLVLALQDLTMSRPLHVPVDAHSEKEGFMVFAGEMIAAVGRMTP